MILPATVASDLNVQTLPQVFPRFTDFPRLLQNAAGAEEWSDANLCDTSEQVLQDPCEPGPCELDGWLGVDLQ